MGISHAWNQQRSNQMLELILDSITPPKGGCASETE